MSEVHRHAEAIIHIAATDAFNKARDRMEDHNLGIVNDNPHAIADSLNTNLPWVIDNSKVEYVVRQGSVIALMKDEE